MSYQVLARKWRPRSFSEVVGQPAVVQALSNALERQQIHHAYLFTGTRGVGKTSLARILAKCLDCETGITHKPCGECGACQLIDQGGFPDLIEIDAASNTRVEDTRDLLDQVMYAPTQGRFKIYLIDEVHMLSTHSFNALLKTLEEPPQHVKFLLATTNPERLPATILSRCLQFHLKPLGTEPIAKQLEQILTQEQHAAETTALNLIAEQAEGSMRDALSLLDQALTYSNNPLTAADVRAMLGLADTQLLTQLLQQLANDDKAGLCTTIDALTASGVDFEHALSGLISLLHQLAWQQQLPAANDIPEILATLAQQLTAEQIQLYYQIALTGRRDLAYTPSPRIGFEMTILRMLAFTLAEETTQTASPGPASVREQPENPTGFNSTTPSPETNQAADWEQILSQLQLTGISQVLAKHCNLLSQDQDNIELLLAKDQAPLLNQQTKERIQQALSDFYQRPINLTIQLGTPQQVTPAAAETQRRQAAQSAAEKHIYANETVQSLQKEFGASIMPESIQPVTEEITK